MSKSLDKINQEIAAKKFCPEVSTAIAILPDVDVDPVTNEVTTPICDLMGWKFTRFTHEVKDRHAVAFKQETGEVYQIKLFTRNNGAKRSGKYFAVDKGDKPYLPQIPPAVARAAAAKVSPLCELSLMEHLEGGGLFWEWIQAWPQIPIVVTEGCYKALAAINAGYIALSLFGVNCGQKAGVIKPELLPYVKKRPVYLAMDSEQNPKSIDKVRKAVSLLGNALSHNAKATVKVVTWDGQIGKGIDDLCAVNPGLFKDAIAAALPLGLWQLWQYFTLDGMESLRLNVPNLTDAIKTIPAAKLIGIKSPKKTFKTELLSVWVAEFLYRGGRVIVPVHREQLAKDLGNRLGLEYRTERTKEGAIFGYCLCVDSLHPDANPAFNPDDWVGCWVILDEADQVFWHLLNSDTCKYNRPAILESLTQLVNVADKIIMASADLNRVCFDYIQSLLDSPAEQYLIVNDWQGDRRPCYVFDKPQQLFTKARECIENGQKIVVHTGGQKDKSKWGTRNLERMLKRLSPALKILRIDRDSVAEPGHPAYGVMGNVNGVLPLYDIVICSPTVETGISINGDRFDAVFCFASGSQTVDAVGQSVERVRADVPRYLWASEKAPLNKIGSGSVNPWALMHREKALLKLNKTLSDADHYADFNLGIKAKHLETWAKFAAHHNQGFTNYRESVYQLLRVNGFKIITEMPLDDGDDAKDLATESAEAGHAEYCEKVANAPIVDDRQYRHLKDKRGKTESERLTEKATAIARRYATNEVTADLVDKDSDPKWYGQLRLHYFLMMGDSLVKERDQERLQGLAKGNGKTFTPDANRACLAPKIKLLREFVGLMDWLDPGRTLTSEDPDLKAWHLKMCKASRDIKKILGIAINIDPDAKGNSPIAVLNRFAKMLGLKFDCVGIDTREGIPTRLYQLTDPDPDDRAAIFHRWQPPTQSEPQPAPDPVVLREVIQQDLYKYKNKKQQSCCTQKSVQQKAGGFKIGDRVKATIYDAQTFLESTIEGVVDAIHQNYWVVVNGRSVPFPDVAMEGQA